MSEAWKDEADARHELEFSPAGSGLLRVTGVAPRVVRAGPPAAAAGGSPAAAAAGGGDDDDEDDGQRLRVDGSGPKHVRQLISSSQEAVSAGLFPVSSGEPGGASRMTPGSAEEKGASELVLQDSLSALSGAQSNMTWSLSGDTAHRFVAFSAARGTVVVLAERPECAIAELVDGKGAPFASRNVLVGPAGVVGFTEGGALALWDYDALCRLADAPDAGTEVADIPGAFVPGSVELDQFKADEGALDDDPPPLLHPRPLPRLRAQLETAGHSAKVNSSTWLTEHVFASASTDDSVKVWDTRQLSAPKKVLNCHAGTVWAVVNCGDGNIITGSTDRTIQEHNWRSGNKVCSYPSLDTWVMSLALMNDRDTIVASGEKGSTTLISRESGKVLRTVDHLHRVKGTSQNDVWSTIAFTDAFAVGLNDASLRIYDKDGNCLGVTVFVLKGGAGGASVLDMTACAGKLFFACSGGVNAISAGSLTKAARA